MAVRNILISLGDGVREDDQYTGLMPFVGAISDEPNVAITIQRVNQYVVFGVGSVMGTSNGSSTYIRSMNPIPVLFRPSAVVGIPIVVSNGMTLIGGLFISPDGFIQITGGPTYQSPFTVTASTIIGTDYQNSLTYSIA